MPPKNKGGAKKGKGGGDSGAEGGGKEKKGGTSVKDPYEDSIYNDSKGNVFIKINAKPGSKENILTDISEDGVGVQVAAPPVDGAANTELIKYMARVLGVRKSDVSLERGSKSRQKTLMINGTGLSALTVLQLIQKSVKK